MTPSRTWLHDALAGRPRPAAELLAAGAEVGFPPRTLRYALQAIGFSARSGFGRGSTVWWCRNDVAEHWRFPMNEPPQFAPISTNGDIGASLEDLERVIAGGRGLRPSRLECPLPADGVGAERGHRQQQRGAEGHGVVSAATRRPEAA